MVSTSPTPNRNPQFSNRKDAHRIIFAKGQKVTSLHIHPFFAFSGALVSIVFIVGYLFATGYLMFRDDLINASRIRQASIQNAYEDKLATLRIEIDRIASRQMLDQKSVENKIDRLLGLRESLDERQRTVSSLAQSASAAGISTPLTAPLNAPSPRPHPKRAAAKPNQQAANHVDQQITGSVLVAHNGAPTHKAGSVDEDAIDLGVIEKNLFQIERTQAKQLNLLAKKTADSSRDIARLLRSLGFKAPAAPPHPADAIGGPYVEDGAFNPIKFDHTILALEENLTHLNKLKKTINLLPLKRPLKTGSISSNFGRRLDPFLKRYAVHSGIDFKAPSGTRVYATAPGKVIKAEWTGGYGRMVEIQHSGNIVTRYAHLSRIFIKEGEYVSAGKVIGSVGSTGRSTGPHLHYETRLNKKALNPIRFLKAGKRVRSL